ncbi:hypothetical protein GA0061100_106299 [Rhizobium hainanense]|uniref:Uncharacterized protein n=1 Tax=Rhizobium hainanense TaxID=52131 RepID=A0A1C3VKT8_9HYPH|nr:hypothetical protein GA0061100_106299 [Rhizobium hainanense]
MKARSKDGRYSPAFAADFIALQSGKVAGYRSLDFTRHPIPDTAQ